MSIYHYFSAVLPPPYIRQKRPNLDQAKMYKYNEKNLLEISSAPTVECISVVEKNYKMVILQE